GVAFRIARQTDKCAQIEKGRVVDRGLFLWDKQRSVIPQLCLSAGRIDRTSYIKQTREHSSTVRFDDWDGLIERKCRNGVCGVFSNSWQHAHFIDRCWETAAMSAFHEPCCRLKIPGARVIAESLPRVQHLRLRCACQRGKVRKSPQPIGIIGQHRYYLRLLKHELGNENAVRIASMPPRKITAVTAIPFQQRASEYFAFCHVEQRRDITRCF